MLTNLLDKVSLLYTSFLNTSLAQSIGVTLPDAGESNQGPFSSLNAFVDFIINLVFVVGLALALVFVIVCGIKYATSSGDQGKAEEARNCITNAVIGAIIIIAFRILVNLALNILGFNELDKQFGTVGGS